MEPLTTNPFSLLTFIAAPAILTNASSVSAMATSNRLARSIDRTRTIFAEMERQADLSDPSAPPYLRWLAQGEKRSNLLLRALKAFYLSVGSFAAASLISLLGAAFVATHQDLMQQVALGASMVAGLVGVGGLIYGSGLLVWETRVTLGTLAEETQYMLAHPKKRKLNSDF